MALGAEPVHQVVFDQPLARMNAPEDDVFLEGLDDLRRRSARLDGRPFDGRQDGNSFTHWPPMMRERDPIVN